MSGFTESSKYDATASDYYKQAADAFKRGEIDYSEELCLKAVKLYEQADNAEVSVVYARLGGIAYRRGDFDVAEQWYRKSLEIDVRTCNERAAAQTYHYLSFVANGRGDAVSAEKWLWKSIRITEKQGDETLASASFHQMGLIAYRRDDLNAAEQWYQKSLVVDERTGNERGAAKTYNNMSAIANYRKDFESAERWLWKAIEIKERLGDEIGAGKSYHQLGVVANSREDFEFAENWYLKALEIEERAGNEVGMAHTYFNLSTNARDQKSNETAEEWLRKAIQIFDRRGEPNRVIEMGKVAERAREFELAERLYREALELATKNENDCSKALAYEYLACLAAWQSDHAAAQTWSEKACETHLQLGATASAARICRCLGNVYLNFPPGKRPDFDSAEKWFRKGLEIDANATWRDWLALYVRMWRYRFLSAFSK